MFATILGGLPKPPLPAGAALDEVIAIAIAAQVEAGLEPVTDGRLAWASLDDALGARGPAPLEAWRRAAGLTDRAVKASLPGPYSVAVRRRTRANAVEAARELRAIVVELAQAGCPLVEIVEDEAYRIGNDPTERAAYRDAHAALTDGVARTHLSLAIVGGNADGAGIETILAPAYASLAVDLISGPDNWRLVARAPATCGIVAGAMGAGPDADEGPELILFAARYAASTQGRGLARIGVAVTPGLEGLTWAAAVRRLEAIGRAARLAGLPPGDELASAVDPRSIDIRTAAMGRRRPR